MFDVEYGLFNELYTPNFIQNSDILITLGNRVPKTKVHNR